MKKRLSLGSLSLESFDQSPTGNVNANGQPVNPEQPMITAGYTETIPGGNTGNYAAETRIKAKNVLNAPAMESASEHEAQELWKRIFSAFEVNNDHDKADTLELNAPATDSQLQKLEVAFHGKLSDLFKSLLKIHNGQRDWTADDLSPNAENILPHLCYLLSSDQMLKMSKEMVDNLDDLEDWYGPVQVCDERIQNVQWSPKWLMIGANEDNRGAHYAIDFEPTSKGKVGQMIKIDLNGNERIHLGDSFDAWFRGFVNRLSHHNQAMESQPPRYPLKKALEADAVVVDDDELDALVSQANNLTKCVDNSPEIALEAASDLAKSKMHLRFKRLKDSFADSFKSVNGMIVKYRDRLQELKHELDGTIVHGQLEVNMSGLWQHFSNEAGPVTSNLIGKVREDVAFSEYILTDFSKKAVDELKKLQAALHTGQGNSDDEAKRTALDVEKCSGPAEYMNQKWLCPAGEQPYLSVTGIYGRQGHHPRAVAIAGVALDRLALLACPYNIREYGSFLHGVKKLFVHDSKKTTRLSETDLEQLIKTGEQYLAAAEHYLTLYHSIWPIFEQIDDSLDQIWDDFGLTEYEIEMDDGDKDGYKTTLSWQESATGPVERRAKVFDQLLSVVRNFSDAPILPGYHEMTRALRAAKYHTYIVAAGLKAAQKSQGDKVAQEIFGFGKKETPKPVYKGPKQADIPNPSWDPHHPPSIRETWKTFIEFLKQESPESLKDIRPLKSDGELKQFIAQVKQTTGKQFPAELIELWKLTDGFEVSHSRPAMFDYLDFMTVHWAYDAWQSHLSMMDDDWADSESHIGQGMQGKKWWEPWWIPFTANGSGDSMCVDISPGGGGKSGQVVSWYHDHDGRSVIAPSVAAFFALGVHRTMYRHGHKKDWEAKNAPKPEIKPGRQDDKPAGM